MKIKILSLFLVATLLAGCFKEKDFDLSKSKGIGLDGTYGIALFNDEFTAMDMLKRFDSLNQIFINDDGYISYIAGQNSSSLIGNDYIVLPDQFKSQDFNFSPSLISAFNTASPGTSVLDSIELDWDFSNPPYEIDSILYAQGKLSLEVSSNLSIQSKMRVEILNLYDVNGSFYNEDFNISPSGSVTNNTNINGYFADLTGNGSGNNKLKVKIVIRLDKNSPSDNVSSGSKINCGFEITNQKFKKIFGFFGNEVLTIPIKELEVKLFELSSGQGKISAEDPRLNLYFNNTYGFSVEINSVSPFEAKKQDESIIPITGAPTPFIINAPDNLYELKTSKLTLKSPDVNVKQLVESNIKEIKFGANASINPDGIVKNFALDTSMLTMVSEIEIPFYGSFQNYGFEDTADFTAPEQAENLEYAEIKLIVENSLPIDLSFQVYFLDSVNLIAVDSLFQEVSQTNIIPAASVDANGKSINAAQKTTYMKVSQSLLKKLQEDGCNKVKIKAEAVSFNNGNTPIKIYPEDKIVIKAGVKLKTTGVVKTF